MDELEALVSSCTPQPSVIAVCESWCNPGEPDSFYLLRDYNLYRSDRIGRPGGGTMLYVQSSITHTLLTDHIMPSFESVWVELTTDSSVIRIASLYRPPRGDTRAFCMEMEACIKKCPTTSTLLLGDLNAKHQLWLSTDCTDYTGDSIYSLFSTYNFEQHVHFPTLLSATGFSSCLDIAATNFDVSCPTIKRLPPLGNSDHTVIRGTLHKTNQHTTSPQVERPAWAWCWEPGRVQALKEDLAQTPLLPSDLDCHHLSCNDIWSFWRHRLLQKAHLYCTRFVSSQTSIQHSKPWMTAELNVAIKAKRRLFREYIQKKTQGAWSQYRLQRNKVTSMLRVAKSEFVSDITHPRNTHSSTHRPRLYKLMKALKIPPPQTIPDLTDDTSTAATDLEKGEMLNTFFISQSKQSIGNKPEELPAIHHPAVTSASLTSFRATCDITSQVLKELDPLKSPGDDNIPTRLLKECAKEIAPSLTLLFNLSFDHQEIPQDWRDATVSPLYKRKGSRSSATNYRPISLLSVVAKVQERVVHRQLYSHIAPHLPVGQSGYRHGDGTELQLARLVHEISEARDDGKVVMACFFDLSKAFDRVWHQGLLKKLEHFGTHGAALEWLRAYLSGRRQRVRVGNSKSSWQTIPAGVPQGSVLGPLLFLIYTLDLPHTCTNTSTKCSQFADDTALITSANDFHTAEHNLQLSVSSAARWLSEWHLLVNLSKTVVMHFYHRNRPPPRPPEVSLGNKRLTIVSQQRHLGVILQSNLTWTAQVDHCSAKVSKSLHHLQRVRATLNADALSCIYKTYIRPSLEYASVVISSLSHRESDRLERVQRRAARICLRIPLFEPVNHSILLHKAVLPTLFSRRICKSLLLAHSIFHKYAPPHILALSLPLCIPSQYSLRQPRTFAIAVTRTSRHRDSPLNSALSNFNKLSSIRMLSSREAYKHEVDSLVPSQICCCSQHPSPYSF